MPPRQKNSRSGASARKRTTTAKEKTARAAAAAAALAEADASMAASADEATSTKSAINQSKGCLTAAAARQGVPPIVGIPTPNLQNNSAKPPDFDKDQFIGSCIIIFPVPTHAAILFILVIVLSLFRYQLCLLYYRIPSLPQEGWNLMR